MSIVTKGGDQGTTMLMYNRRVSKCHPRVEAYGAVDELNAAIGLARATAEDDFVRENLAAIQSGPGAADGRTGHRGGGFAALREGWPWLGDVGHDGPARGMWLGKSRRRRFRPGVGPHRARTRFRRRSMSRARFAAARRRRACALQEAGQLQNAEIVVYLNRLSDLLWLFARWVEAKRR